MKLTHHGKILWVAIPIYALSITRFRLAWAWVFVVSFFVARSVGELIGGLAWGWLGISFGIYLYVVRELRR